MQLYVITAVVALVTISLVNAESGICSWYGAEGEIPEGWPTACGEPFSRFAYAAAHKTLPCGSNVRVTNPENGQSVVVRVNDRGPFVEGRILDLTFQAAQEMNFLEKGLINCNVDPA